MQRAGYWPNGFWLAVKAGTLSWPGHLKVSLAFCLSLSLSLLLTCFAPAPVAALAPEPPSISAAAAITVDASTGRILYTKNIHRRVAMASTTKIMTALTALSVEGVKLDELYKVVRQDLVGEASMGLRNGEEISFHHLLHGLLLNSGNDAAMAIGRYAGAKLPGSGDPLARFIARMNQNAATMGLRNSQYANPHGLDQSGHYSSAFDLAITGWYALKNPVISNIVAMPSATVSGHKLTNLNKLIGRYAGANGIKPGMTDDAGLCLVASATRNGQTVIAVLLGENAAGYNANPGRLLDYTFEQLAEPDTQRLLQQGATAATAADYIGQPSGEKLLALAGAVAGSSGNPNVVNPPASNGIINPQISQPQLPSFGVSNAQVQQTTPGTGQGESGSQTTPASSSGGFNPFGLLFLLLIAVGIFYLIVRFAPVGDRGREIAYTMEDVAARGLHLGQSGAQKLWAFVRPGPAEDEPPKQGRPPSPTLTTGRDTHPAAPEGVLRSRVSNEPPKQSAAEPPIRSVSYPREPLSRARSGPSAFDNDAFFNSENPVPSGTKGQNPLENIFDDVDPFNFDEKGQDKPPASPQPQPESDSPASPPRPLTTRPVTEYQVRTAAEPQQKPDNSSMGYRQPPASRPPQPFSPNSFNSTGGAGTSSYGSENTGPETRPGSSYSRPESFSIRPPSTPADSVEIHARQAIDYAYAGRITASTEEFRRVIEQNHLFDFGSIEEFDQMPVLGYKALAYAYRDAGRSKLAVYLLDLAIERYPNDLELRNLFRSMKRETGQ